MVAAVGVDNVAVIDAPDAPLIANRDRAQDVNNLYAELETRGHESHKLYRTVHWPWGTYTVLEEGKGFKIKRIEVKPGAALSLQMHHHRSEHWVVVSGTAKVVNGEQEMLVRKKNPPSCSPGTSTGSKPGSHGPCDHRGMERRLPGRG